MDMEITELTVHELKEKIKNKELTVTQIVEAYIARIEEKEDEIGAFITIQKEEALKKAKELDEKIDLLTKERTMLTSENQYMQLMAYTLQRESLVEELNREQNEIQSTEEKRTNRLLEISFEFGQLVRRKQDLEIKRDELLAKESGKSVKVLGKSLKVKA